MKTRAAFTLGLSAIALAGTLAGVATQVSGMAYASARDESRAERQAASEASKAQKALAKGEVSVAVLHAEAAVGLRPQIASFRVLLGTSYLKAGRFDSARQSYADAIALDPGNGKAALNLALTQIATGDWGAARRTIDAHTDSISASDRGLAMALAGDPTGAVELLSAAVRSPDADAKTRQNLALSLALAGRWQEAKTMVAVDVSPEEVDQRIMQWAAFARPKSAYDQVASLLGVTPVLDPGQPVALALNGTGPAMAAQTVEPVAPSVSENAAVATVDAAAPAPMAEASVAVAPVEVAVAPVAAAPAPAFSSVVFAPSQEVVQRLPVTMATKTRMTPPVGATAPVRTMARQPVVARTAAKGNYVVQLGAFESAGVAKDAWGRATRRDASFSAHSPSGMSFSSQGGKFYRLSVGGLARADAVALCGSFKAKGGTCFVRLAAGDQVADWVRPAGQLASR
ncbi:MAG: tetratricopeptide repeat protein [Sphingomonas sp.]